MSRRTNRNHSGQYSGFNSFVLNWMDNSDNETGFSIQRRVNDGPWEENYDQIPSDVTEYIDTNKGSSPMPSGSYGYRIAAVNDTGQSALSNEVSAEILDQNDADRDGDGVSNDEDGCPDDGGKTAPGACGCGVSDADGDEDGTPDCDDQCPQDPEKTDPGLCGCGIPESDQCSTKPQVPTLMTPTDAATDTDLSSSLETGEFQDPDNGDIHAQTIWQISKNDAFGELLYN